MNKIRLVFIVYHFIHVYQVSDKVIIPSLFLHNREDIILWLGAVSHSDTVPNYRYLSVLCEQIGDNID